MKKFYVIYCVTGLQGCEHYSSLMEASRAADLRLRLTGVPWYVRELASR